MTVSVRITAQDALWLVKLTLAATSKDDVSPVLTAAQVTLERHDGRLRLRMTSTDRYRVHSGAVDLIPASEHEPIGVGDDLQDTPWLLQRDQLTWLSKNAPAYTRGPGVSLVELSVEEGEDPEATITVMEHGSKGARRQATTALLLKGNFPPVVRLREGVTDGDPAPLFGVNPTFLADAQLLTRSKGEPVRLHAMREGDGTSRNKLRPFLLENVDDTAWIMIQPNELLR